MSVINECLKQIMSARYGKDVRKAIYDGIKEADSVARAAQNSATANAQTASAKASEALQASQEALQKAQEAEESAQQAKVYAENAEAVTGVNIATKDSAGIVKGGENHIAEDGTLELVVNTTETTMPNSRKGGLLFDEIGGACEQVTTTGSQLFDGILEQGTYDGDLNKTDSNYRIRNANNIAVIPFETYTISSSVAKNIALYALDANGKKIAAISLWGSLPLTFTISNDVSYIAFVLRIGDTTAITPSSVNDVMLNTGTEALPWEPYTGGMPSPSPEYPQEIKKSVVSEIRTHGKNFLKNTHEKETTTNGLTFITNDDGTITINGTATADTNYNLGGNEYPRMSGLYQNLVQIGGTFNGEVKHIAFTKTWGDGGGFQIGKPKPLKENLVYMYFRMVITKGTVCNNLVVGFMICEDLESSYSYEPYTENTIFFMDSIELYGNGDIQDVIEDGKVKRRFKKVVFDGSSDEMWATSTLKEGRYYVEGVANSKLLGVAICTHSIHSNGATTEYLNRSYFSESVDGRFIINTSFATLSEWKAHLQANPMTLIYELAEEENEDLSIPYQITFNSLPTYDGTTYLEFNSDVKPTSKCKYATSLVGSIALESLIKERNNELKIALLEATVVNSI